MFAAEKTRDRNIDNGAIACGRSSSTTNAAMAATATRTPATITARPRVGHAVSRYVETPRATAPASAPATSNRPVAVSSRDSGARTPISTTSAHSGRLIAKIQRQPAWSTRKPPMRGPMAVATPARPAQVPMAAGRSSGRNDAWMRARAPGTSRAAAAPCSTRNTASWTGDWANAHKRAAEGEAHHAEEIDPPASQPVPQCATDQDQRGQAQQVAGGDPLQLRQRGVEVEADLAQRDVDDRAVQHRDPGAEDDRGQGDPAAGGAKLEEPDLRFVVRVAIRRAPRHGRP